MVLPVIMVKPATFFFIAMILMGILLGSTGSAEAVAPEKRAEQASDCTGEADGEGQVSDFCKDSCETVVDASKLLISLCTGMFVLIPTFLGLSKKKILKAKWVLIVGFILLSVSIFVGVNVIYFVAGSQRWGEYDILENHIGLSALTQLISFAFGAVLVGLFLLVNILRAERPSTEEIFSEKQLRMLLNRAVLLKVKGEYEKAECLLDLISENLKGEMKEGL